MNGLGSISTVLHCREWPPHKALQTHCCTNTFLDQAACHASSYWPLPSWTWSPMTRHRRRLPCCDCHCDWRRATPACSSMLNRWKCCAHRNCRFWVGTRKELRRRWICLATSWTTLHPEQAQSFSFPTNGFQSKAYLQIDHWQIVVSGPNQSFQILHSRSDESTERPFQIGSTWLSETLVVGTTQPVHVARERLVQRDHSNLTIVFPITQCYSVCDTHFLIRQHLLERIQMLGKVGWVHHSGKPTWTLGNGGSVSNWLIISWSVVTLISFCSWFGSSSLWIC